MVLSTFRSANYTSPSLYEQMRVCFLKAAFSRSREARSFVPTNPMSILGEVCHDVLHRAATGSKEPLEILWKISLEAHIFKLQGSISERRLGPPENWPGYHLALAGLRARFDQTVRNSRAAASSHSALEQEKPFFAYGNKLCGRPDIVSQDEIIDYKSGNIYEQFESCDAEKTVKKSYLRQLRLYAAIVADVRKEWPRYASIIPLSGERVCLEVNRDDCISEATQALDLLHRFNEKLQNADTISDLASPSSESCHQCSFQLVCPAFWKEAASSWDFRYLALEGVLTNSPSYLQRASDLILHLRVTAGTVDQSSELSLMLDSSLHKDLATFTTGDVLRISGLMRNKQGALQATSWTTVIRVADIPKEWLT